MRALPLPLAISSRYSFLGGARPEVARPRPTGVLGSPPVQGEHRGSAGSGGTISAPPVRGRPRGRVGRAGSETTAASLDPPCPRRKKDKDKDMGR